MEGPIKLIRAQAVRDLLSVRQEIGWRYWLFASDKARGQGGRPFGELAKQAGPRIELRGDAKASSQHQERLLARD